MHKRLEFTRTYALHQVTPERAAPPYHQLYKILLMTLQLLFQTLFVTAHPQYWSLFITHHPLHKILLMTVHSLHQIQLVTCHPLYPILLTTECPYIVSDPIYKCPHTETNPTYDTLSTVWGPSCDFHFPVSYSIYVCLFLKVQIKCRASHSHWHPTTILFLLLFNDNLSHWKVYSASWYDRIIYAENNREWM
jgi:hypothetical protein